ncbi:MAG: Asp-tRNA(Asn)/Glu-tRNA(Gln) amidotransferase subunit GatB [Spirochaetes bacterium]|nr:Asp-tRNA(Asn)/Glu-tRNA(Gln) amidotransferase subunit GatB [Spirochaetota bacterium]
MKKNKYLDFENLIKLSAITLDDDERKIFQKELEDFLNYSEIINNFPVENLKAASHAVEKEVYFRDDIVKKWDNLDKLLNNAPLIEDTSFIVPPQKGRTADENGAHDMSNAKIIDHEEYEAVIGLEVHAQLKTKSKLFCSCSTEFGKKPNSNTCPVCTGQPGSLPVLNMEAVNMAIKAGLSANCQINMHSVFARKNYFYPDLPKAYQISQFEEPICSKGYIEIEIDGKIKKIRLNRIHMEEDAGKLVHIGAPGIWGSKASAVDFNRTGIPLIEIVTEPDINSAKEAKEYVIMLRAILVSLGICDGNMEEGSLRCDANISIRKKGETILGTKTEIKNMNSFKAIERAIDFEIKRQKKMKKFGFEIFQETRLWDESSQKTILMRSKEESHDYRYFPDPDLLPLVLTKDWIESYNKVLPELPLKRKKKYIEKYQFSEDEAKLFMTNPDYADYFEEVLKFYDKPRNCANWFFNEILCYASSGIKNIIITPYDLGQFLLKIDNDEISGKIGKYVIEKAFESKKSLNQIIEEENLKQITDNSTIEKIIIKILEKNKNEVESYKNGKTNLFAFFVGQVMKETKGKANPKLVNKVLKSKLDEIQ